MHPIGIIHTRFTSLEEMPIQPAGARDERAEIVIDPKYTEGLKDLDGFSHLYLIYRFHLSDGYALTVTPFLDKKPRGLFATRAPRRPNPIGLSLVRLEKVQDNRMSVFGADVIDGTPLLDIKPYVPAFDGVEDAKSGWVSASKDQLADKRSDRRFAD
ncbi:MAG: tRNA (N6-threonylcarbamoyladenosine(37)-N6)-methyltransferase TrmO [Candidatus Sedimenticola endophacoides]